MINLVRLMLIIFALTIEMGVSEKSVSAGIIVSDKSVVDEKPEIFVQLGHASNIASVAFSPDSKWILSAGRDNVMILWDVASGREIRAFKGHAGQISNVFFSSDGKHALSSGGDCTIRIWDIQTGLEIKKISTEKVWQQVNSIAVSPDGKFIVSGGADSTVRLWDISTGSEIKTLRERHMGAAAIVAYSPNGKYILSSDRSEIKLWDAVSKNERRTFKGCPVWSVAFSPDSKYAVLGCTDNTIRVLDIMTGIELKKIGGHSGWVYSVVFSPDGKYILSGSGDATVRLWDSTTGKEIRQFAGYSRGVYSVAFSPDGRYAISGDYDKVVRLFDVATGQEIKQFRGFSDYIESVTFSPDGKYALTGSFDMAVRLWDISRGELLRVFKGHEWSVYSVVFSPDGKYILSGSGDKTIKLWDATTGEEIKTFRGHTDGVKSVAFSSDGKYILSAGDNEIKLWDAVTGMEIRTFKGHKYFITRVIFSPNGKYILSGGADQIIKLWDTSTGKEIRTFKCRYYSIDSISFTADSKYILSGSGNEIRLWEVSTGKELRRFKVQQSFIKTVISPHGENVLSGGISDDYSIKLFDVSTGKEIRQFIGHAGTINSVAISSDSRYALSGSGDNTTRIWDISTGKEIATFVAFTDDEWVVITPEGYFNASPNGAKHLNVRVGNNVYSIDNFYEKFFNPVYVTSVLQGKKIEAVADIRKGILTPPEVKIISPEPNAEFNKDTIDITVSAKDTGGGIDEIRLYHNGKAIGEDQRAVKIVPKGNETIKTYTVTLIDGANTFKATGFSKDRTEANTYELIVKLTAPQKDVSLYILVVGINKYKNPALNLNYAEPDAKGIANFFKQKGKGLFKKVEYIEIYNEQATKETIISKLKQLQNTQPQDAVLIYLAGHGESVSDNWYFIPHELTYPEREEDMKTKGVSSNELSGHIKDIRAQKILVLIDACKSGAVLIAFRGFEDRKALSQLSRSTGVHIVAASTKDQFAAEVKDLGHGVFTYTLLEGLKGRAAGAGETVTVRKLMGYIEEQLPEITRKYKQEAQYPVVDSRGMDFPLVTTK